MANGFPNDKLGNPGGRFQPIDQMKALGESMTEVPNAK